MLAPGRTLQNRYTITGTLGHGGMGAVYLAEDSRLPGRRCAIKENLPDPHADPQALAQARQQFLDEASILARLDHPNLPKVSDYFAEGGREYLVMDFVEGEDLESALQRTGKPLPEKPVLIWTDQVLDALEYLHGQQPQPVIHRDIKPANIRLTPQGKVKLVDFGLVKLLDPNDPRTKTGLRGLGTPEYAPLEQYAVGGAGHTDARSDIYSLGATLYHLLTDSAPPDVHQRMLNPSTLTPPRQLNPKLSQNTEQVVLRAMEVHPDQRYQTAREMHQALKGTVQAPTPTTPTGQAAAYPRQAAPWWRQSRLKISIAALGLGVVLIIGLVLGSATLTTRFAGRRVGTPPGVTTTPPALAIVQATTTPAPVVIPTKTAAPLAETPTEPLATTPVAVENEYDRKRVQVVASQTWGSQGAAAGQLLNPKGLEVDDEGYVYVADAGNSRIVKFGPDSQFIAQWGSNGTRPGEFKDDVWGMAVDTERGFVYVADTWNHRIQKFDLNGQLITWWGTFVDTGWPTEFAATEFAGQFWGPRDIDIDDEGNLYVTDTANKRIQKFDPKGNFLSQWGGIGFEPGKFNEPVGITISKTTGDIFVADTWNRRVQRFDRNMVPLTQWPINGWTGESVNNKPYIAVDADDNVYVTDPGVHQIYKFDNQGKLLAVFGQLGTDSASFNFPTGIDIGPDGNIYIADSFNHRVMKFSSTLTAGGPTGSPARPPAEPTAPPTGTPVTVSATLRDLTDRFGMEFAYVPAGEFLMGSPAGEGGDDEHPQHTVYVDEFWIGKTEVTNAQYRHFVEAGGYQQPELWTAAGWEWREENDATQPECWDDERWNQPDYPVVCVNWYEAVAYTRWLARETGLEVRPPTEAEWEKAARGTDGRTWPWGEEPPDGSRLNYCDRNCEYDWNDEAVDDGYQYTAPAGAYPAGASPYGALDMAGNVWEWTESLREDYPYQADDGREGLEGSECCRVVRGGAWGGRHVYARPAFRGRDHPDDKGNHLGLRVVVVAPH